MQSIPPYLDFSSLSHDAINARTKELNLKLSAEEALIIQKQLLKRPPTYAECVLWSIQGSEHCSYKSSRQYLKQLNTAGPNVILGAKEDAGIVEIAKDQAGYRYGLVISHESHNHPSQIVPYEGAATGVGGNVRDVCCMGAEVIAVADSLRFGDISRAKTHFIRDGVVSGIAGYGNPIGVPNLAGDVYFNAGYNDNCLVTIVTLGLVREDHIIHSYAPPNLTEGVFIVVGKATDNSGFGGASFASDDLNSQELEKNKGLVQEPNAFLQRHLLKANYALFKILQEKKLIDRVGFKDLGAGGIACATVELAESGGYGALIEIEQIPTSMPHLNPAVLLCAETQERFMWVVPSDLVPLILTHYNETFALPDIAKDARAAVIGRLTAGEDYLVKHYEQIIIHANTKAITQGLKYDRPFIQKKTEVNEPILHPENLNQVLLRLLAHENNADKSPIFENYDKQVQGRTVVEAGAADAGVIQPFNDPSYPVEIQKVGVALSLDHNPRYNLIDPYWGAVNAVCEAVRNVVAVGAAPIALTDCLCFGNPENPALMGEFVAGVSGLRDAADALTLTDYPSATLPIIAGNVSFYNSSEQQSIPPSPMICCVGRLPNVDKVLTYAFKEVGSSLIMIGERHNECGGSLYYDLYQQLGALLPKPNLSQFNQEIHALYQAVQQDLILSMHDISDGGIAVALSEMTFKREIGVKVMIPGNHALASLLFSESGGFVLEVAPFHLKKLRALFHEAKVAFWEIGCTTKIPFISINEVINVSIQNAKAAFTHGLREKLL